MQNKTREIAGNIIMFSAITITAFALDIWTKSAVFRLLAAKENQTISVIQGFFNLVIRVNAGAAFSIATGQRTFLITTSIVALAVIIGILIFARPKRKILLIALAMFTAGVLGNLYDRIFNDGFVRDFIDIYYRNWHWPAFNIADSLLCVSVTIFVILNIRKTEKKTAKASHNNNSN